VWSIPYVYLLSFVSSRSSSTQCTQFSLVEKNGAAVEHHIRTARARLPPHRADRIHNNL